MHKRRERNLNRETTKAERKEEYVCLLRMTQLQRALYQRYMLDLTSRSGQSPNPLRAFVVSCKVIENVFSV